MKIAMLLILILTSHVNAAERIATKKMQDVYDFVVKKKAEVGAESILVVYDFDNTLMAMNQDLGSDQWYNWQSELLKKGVKKDAVVGTRSELFELHYKLFALGEMHLVEPEIATIVKDIQGMKIKSIVLTSRGSDYRNDVELELDRAGLDFSASAIGPEGGYPSYYKPENLENARFVSYQNGIYMGSGQNKGQLLRNLIKKTNSSFKSIIFVDDTLKNVENVEKEYADDKSVNVFYYTHEEERVKKFELDKSQAKKEWKAVKAVLEFYKKDNARKKH